MKIDEILKDRLVHALAEADPEGLANFVNAIWENEQVKEIVIGSMVTINIYSDIEQPKKHKRQEQSKRGRPKKPTTDEEILSELNKDAEKVEEETDDEEETQETDLDLMLK